MNRKWKTNRRTGFAGKAITRAILLTFEIGCLVSSNLLDRLHIPSNTNGW